MSSFFKSFYQTVVRVVFQHFPSWHVKNFSSVGTWDVRNEEEELRCHCEVEAMNPLSPKRARQQHRREGGGLAVPVVLLFEHVCAFVSPQQFFFCVCLVVLVRLPSFCHRSSRVVDM